MGQRIAVMRAGKLQQVGAPLELYEQPANLFVAGFIGTPPMNFVPATIADGGATVAASGFRLPLPERWRSATAGGDGRRVVLGVRPEDVREVERAGNGRRGTLPLTVGVEFVEPLGHEVIVHGRVGDDLLVAKVDPHRAPEIGADFPLVLATDAVHLFDATTEARLAGGTRA
jgi:multiple sugar transport system ATP-binding protein